MRKLARLTLPLVAVSGAAVIASTARADAVIPSDFDADINIVITLNSDGTFTTTDVPGSDHFDGDEETLVKVINHSASPLLSLDVESNTDIFGFDNDGISAYTGLASDATGYGSPDSYFGNIDASETTGTVYFANGISAGGTDYFSLEEAVSLADQSFAVIPPAAPSVPDSAATAGLLGACLLALGALRRRLGLA